MRLGAVGDVARTLPAASRVRAAYPGAHLAWLVEPDAASLLAGVPWIDEVLLFPRPALVRALRALEAGSVTRALRDLLSRLRARRFDLVVDFHSILRSALLALATGSRRRIGYAPPFGRELAWALATHRARITPARTSRFERNEGLVGFLGIEARSILPALPVPPRASSAMRERLGPGPAPVAMHPGTSVGASRKRFPPALFARVARALAAEHGVTTVVTHGPAVDDLQLAEAVVREAPEAARLAPPTPTVADLAALLANVRVAIGPDTGPLHVAALVGTPVVQLLGPTDAVENAPWPGTPSRTLHAGRTPGSARRAGAPELPAEAIVAAVRDLLAGPARRDAIAGANR